MEILCRFFVPSIEKADDEAVLVGEHPSPTGVGVDGSEVLHAPLRTIDLGWLGAAAGLEFVAIEEYFETVLVAPSESAHS